mgnify:CR=1 FL=1
MAITKEQKKEVVESLKEGLQKQKAAVFVGVEGLEAADLFELRSRLKENECKISVVKKTLMNRAFSEEKIEMDAQNLEGQAALILGFEDPISPAKIAYNFTKENENLKIIGGLFENKFIDSEEIISLAKIPSKEELLAKVVGSISSPLSGFVNVLQGSMRALVYTLNAIENKK